MLAGALAAVVVSSATGGVVSALAAALLIGAALGLVMSLIITRLAANEIIVGLGFNIAIAGFVRFWLKSAHGVSGTFNPPDVVMLPRYRPSRRRLRSRCSAPSFPARTVSPGSPGLWFP